MARIGLELDKLGHTHLLTRIVMATSVTFMGLASKNTDRSLMLRRVSGVHSPTLTIECCLRRIKSNLN